jgi:hypothetical protein
MKKPLGPDLARGFGSSLAALPPRD